MNFYLFNLRCFYYLSLHEKYKKYFLNLLKKEKKALVQKYYRYLNFLNKKICLRLLYLSLITYKYHEVYKSKRNLIKKNNKIYLT